MKQKLLNGENGGDVDSADRKVEARGSSLFIKRVADLEKSDGGANSGRKGNSAVIDSEASPFDDK